MTGPSQEDSLGFFRQLLLKPGQQEAVAASQSLCLTSARPILEATPRVSPPRFVCPFSPPEGSTDGLPPIPTCHTIPEPLPFKASASWPYFIHVGRALPIISHRLDPSSGHLSQKPSIPVPVALLPLVLLPVVSSLLSCGPVGPCGHPSVATQAVAYALVASHTEPRCA